MIQLGNFSRCVEWKVIGVKSLAIGKRVRKHEVCSGDEKKLGKIDRIRLGRIMNPKILYNE